MCAIPLPTLCTRDGAAVHVPYAVRIITGLEDPDIVLSVEVIPMLVPPRHGGQTRPQCDSCPQGNPAAILYNAYDERRVLTFVSTFVKHRA